MLGFLPGLDPLAITKIEEFVVFIGVVSMCAAVLYLVYRHVSPRDTDELEFASTIFILTIAIGLLVSIIKHAPAISFGLFGAMSIVRFRAQIKRPQRMIFIFMAAAIGVCCGAGEYLITVLGTLVLSALTIASFSLAPPRLKSKTKAENKAALAAAALALPTTTTATATTPAHSRWGIDFLPVSFGDGRRVKVLVIVDETSREALAVVPETSFSGARVVGELDRLIAERGKPQSIISDTWPQFASPSVLDWKQAMGIEWSWLEQSASPEPFVVRAATLVREQCVSGQGYGNLIQARAGLETWRLAFNHENVSSGDSATRTDRVYDHSGPRLAVTTLREPSQSAPQPVDAELGIAVPRIKASSAL